MGRGLRLVPMVMAMVPPTGGVGRGRGTCLGVLHFMAFRGRGGGGGVERFNGFLYTRTVDEVFCVLEV